LILIHSLISLNGSQHVDIALKCLDVSLIKRKEYSLTRVAAFAKQILTVALHTSSTQSGACAAPLLAFVRTLTSRYSGVHRLFENELDIVATGTYNPQVEDPEHSNPFSANAWELALMKFHVNDTVIGKQARDCSTLKLSTQPMKEAPNAMHRVLLKQHNEGTIHHRISQLKRHPLAVKGNENRDRIDMIKANNKRKRSQIQLVRFITPHNKTGKMSLLPNDEAPVTPIDF
jgi:hypothetical protein